jgi:hypothetical protein
MQLGEKPGTEKSEKVEKVAKFTAEKGTTA